VKANPVVDFIIPNRNNVAYIGECLQSVRAQTYKNWRCILVDDGSTDHSVELIEKLIEGDERFQLITLSERAGVSRARNLGIDASFGDYVSFVDSDDILLPEYLEVLVNEATRSGSDYTRCRHWLFRESGKLEPNDRDDIWSAPVRNISFHDHASAVFYFSSWATLIKRSVLANEVRYPENVALGEDRIFNQRAMLSSGKISQISSRLYKWRRLGKGSGQATHHLLESFAPIRISITEWVRQTDTLDETFADHKMFVHTSAFFELWWHVWRLRNQLFNGAPNTTWADVEETMRAINPDLVDLTQVNAKAHHQFMQSGYEVIMRNLDLPIKPLVKLFVEEAGRRNGRSEPQHAANTDNNRHPLSNYLAEYASLQGDEFIASLIRQRWFFHQADLVQAALVQRSGMFDKRYYIKQVGNTGGLDPALHFVRYGAVALINPQAKFNTKDYYERFPELWASGMNPIVHRLLATGG
jgi:glycosyltransferase involved in cell wall biosynthesis